MATIFVCVVFYLLIAVIKYHSTVNYFVDIKEIYESVGEPIPISDGQAKFAAAFDGLLWPVSVALFLLISILKLILK